MTLYPLTDGFTLLHQEGGEAPQEARFLRDTVFVEEQMVSIEEEYDGLDVLCNHYVLLKNETPLATARVRPSGEAFKLERMAVDAQHRNRGFGRKLLLLIMNQPFLSGADIYLHAQIQAAGFYEKLGFKTEGAEFEEAHIRHIKMRIKLS